MKLLSEGLVYVVPKKSQENNLCRYFALDMYLGISLFVHKMIVFTWSDMCHSIFFYLSKGKGMETGLLDP